MDIDHIRSLLEEIRYLDQHFAILGPEHVGMEAHIHDRIHNMTSALDGSRRKKHMSADGRPVRLSRGCLVT